MTVKVAINGFGRIGRNILRAIVESGRKDIQVVAINDLGPVETNAHLLRFDRPEHRAIGEDALVQFHPQPARHQRLGHLQVDVVQIVAVRHAHSFRRDCQRCMTA